MLTNSKQGWQAWERGQGSSHFPHRTRDSGTGTQGTRLPQALGASCFGKGCPYGEPGHKHRLLLKRGPAVRAPKSSGGGLIFILNSSLKDIG